jgi:Co/Zn/Cd efflux system component
VQLNSSGWRRALWIALIVNAAFFVTEVVAGGAAGSAALQADALDPTSTVWPKKHNPINALDF